MTPFQAFYGLLPPTIPSYSKGSTSIQALEDMLIERDSMLCSLKENLRQTQHLMAQKANLHRRETQLQVGDKVLVRLQAYRQASVAKRSSHKLARRYYGPFAVVEHIGPVAYKLDLPTDCRIHPVFRFSLLKPYVGNSSIDVYSLPPRSVDNKPLSLPIAICAERYFDKAKKFHKFWCNGQIAHQKIQLGRTLRNFVNSILHYTLRTRYAFKE